MKDDVIRCPALAVDAGQFSGSRSETVLLSGKVFEIGEYPDRGFAIEAEEMDQAISEFAPVANDLEHSRLQDVLGNSLGELRKLWRVGRDVFGEVSVPRWLADLTGNALKVSLAFNRAKRVVGNALTLSPRVSDAEVVAAFSGRRHSAGDEDEIQRIHDLAVSQGAKCGVGFSVREWLTGLFRKEDAPVTLGLRPFDGGDVAARFAEDAVKAKKFLPCDKPYLQKAFAGALIADSAGRFSEGEGDCCGALRQMVEERPAHELSEELLAGAAQGHLAPGNGISEERRNELLGKSDLGREVRKAKRSKAQ